MTEFPAGMTVPHYAATLAEKNGGITPFSRFR
jgi:hypothetical protein